jgi:hypothetical protein
MPQHRTCIYNSMAIVEGYLENFQRALELYEKALEIRKKCFGRDDVGVADTYQNMRVA